MKLENNWRFKSIESLEKKNYGPVPTAESSIVERAWRLRKVPINELQVDDVRFLIIQGIALKYLLPLAIEVLQENLLTEAGYYEGDLLNAVLQIEKDQWAYLQGEWVRVDGLVKDQVEFLRTIEPKLKLDNFYACRPMEDVGE